MHLTAMTDCSLRLLMHVAQHPERLCTIGEIAHAHAISEAHLMKITHRLALAGWIETVRGRRGGMRLARRPQDIRVGDIVRSVEPGFALVDCFSTRGSCTLTGSCRLADVFEGALAQFMRHLDGFTLADVLPKAGARVPGIATVILQPRAS